jgi:hypothetical protein
VKIKMGMNDLVREYEWSVDKRKILLKMVQETNKLINELEMKIYMLKDDVEKDAGSKGMETAATIKIICGKIEKKFKL